MLHNTSSELLNQSGIIRECLYIDTLGGEYSLNSTRNEVDNAVMAYSMKSFVLIAAINNMRNTHTHTHTHTYEHAPTHTHAYAHMAHFHLHVATPLDILSPKSILAHTHTN